MKCLIVEDDFVARKLMQVYLSERFDCFVAISGIEAVRVFKKAMDEDKPYDLICLDIMMPEMDGHEVLREIRQIESEYGIEDGSGCKVIMTTALGDASNIIDAFRSGCEAYIVKPVGKDELYNQIEKLGLHLEFSPA